MYSLEDIELLKNAAVRRAVEENLGREPSAVALDKKIPHAALVATQVKYLQRARRKLPSYYAARCIILPMAYEQSSGEEAAANKDFAGALCVDLTCGLGVDSLYFSKRFARVIAVERDPVLASLARYNFGLLGADNIEVVNAAAEDFLAANPGLKADLIYADPARRDGAGRKTVALADCSPDIGEMLPYLRERAATLAVKLSPMFDVAEAFRIFGEKTRVEVVSAAGEVKEVLVATGDVSSAVRATALGVASAEYPLGMRTAPMINKANPDEYQWLIAPDAALAKAGMARVYYAERGAYIAGDHAFAFADTLPQEPFGQAYRIVSAQPYAPKKIRRELSAEGVRSLNILKRGVPGSGDSIARELGVREGGEEFAAVAAFGGGTWFIRLGRIGSLNLVYGENQNDK